MSFSSFNFSRENEASIGPNLGDGHDGANGGWNIAISREAQRLIPNDLATRD